MLDRLGQNYPYKRERSAQLGLANLHKNNDSRNFNIITCIDKPVISIGAATAAAALPSINSSRPRKLGDYVDFPNPKNKKKQDTLIDFNAQPASEMQRAIRDVHSIDSFVQKNLMNSSSIGYNFISNTTTEAPKTTHQLRDEHPNITNRTKQIGTIYDQGRLFAPNFNPEYQTYYKSSSIPFNRSKGMCTDTYNRAHTYGPGLKPFRKLK